MSGAMLDRILGANAPSAMAPPDAGVRLRALRPFWFNGCAVEAGRLVDVPAAMAADVIRSSRAEIVDAEQWTEIRAALDAANLRFERESRRHRAAGR